MWNEVNKPERLNSILNNEIEKVYSVGFMEYTDNTREYVVHNIDKNNYLHVGNQPFLVRESDLTKYVKYGKGYEFIDFVGMITKSNANINSIMSKPNSKIIDTKYDEDDLYDEREDFDE